MQPLDHQQRLFMVESDQLYRAWIDALIRAGSYRYGMKWVTSKGRQYLVRLHDSRGNGKSLGPRNEQTEALYHDFVEGKARAGERLKGLSERMERQVRLNRAARLGRLPRVVGSILLRMAAEDLRDDFCVIGTHAIYAYEALAGVRCRMDLLASGDIDLLYDARRKVSIATAKLAGRGLLGLLQRTDRRFQALPGERFRAANNDGFMVDLVTPARDMRDPAPITFGQSDLVAVEVPNLHWLVNAPKVSVIAISSDGRPVMMRVPDPRAFALHKAWLCVQPDREPLKRPRDQAQAVLVASLVLEYLPALEFDPAQLRFFSAQMLKDARRMLSDKEGIDLPGLEP